MPRLRRRVDAGDKALGRAAAHAVLIESAGGLAGAIETGDDLAVHVDHLALRIDSEPGPRIVHHRSRPGGIDGQGLFRQKVGARPGVSSAQHSYAVAYKSRIYA